jgi:caspase domain-containing protein
MPSQLLASLVSQLAALVLAGRVAIVASAGVADGQASLRYAERDADRVASVLRELGGFDRVYQLREPGVGMLRDALAAVDREAAGDPNLEVVFYYSGHADAQGLLLDHERFSFDELRARLEQSHALVRVAFLDACYAGGIVRPKGGHPAPSYTLENVEPPHVRGAAIIAAGTASELAQESSEIEGSYFTHHMLSGLRGAGDRDGNGLVTLAEAYQYAYSHTLAATLPSVWGPQHPSYEYRLSGTGDLVMTRLGRDRRALSFPPSVNGRARAYVVSNAAGEVMAEVAGRPDARVRIVLPAGRYHVIARDDRQSARADVSLGAAPGPDVLVEAATFQPIAPDLAMAKGGRLGIRQEIALDVTLTGLGPSNVMGTPEFGAGYLRRRGRFSFGGHVGYGANEGVISNVPYALQRWTFTALALRRTTIAFSEVQWGLGLGVEGLREQLPSIPATAPQARFGWAPAASATLALDLPIVRWFALRLMWSVGVALPRINGVLTPSPALRASLGAVLSD